MGPRDTKRPVIPLVTNPLPTPFPNKLVPPQLSGLVARQRLFREIEQAPSRGIAWVSAPPGAGKSSLVASWLYSGQSTARHGHALWYRMDETDADPVIFFGTLTQALAELPDAPRDILPRLTPEALPDLDIFVRNWFKALLNNKARAPFLFAFDDLHRLPPDSSVVGALAALANGLLPRDRLLCLSRENPPGNFLSAVQATRLVHVTHLQVEVEEWEDFRRDVPGAQDLTPEAFATMAQRSGRWIGDLVVAPSRHPSLSNLMNHPLVASDRLLAGYDDTDRRALIDTAFLQIGGEEEWARLGGEHAFGVLKTIADGSALITRLLNGALRKHDLFFEQLRAAAELELEPASLARIRLRTGRLLAARGEMLSGVRLLTQAGAVDEARDLVLAHANDMITNGKNRELLELISMLPETIRVSPLIRVWDAVGRLPFEPSSAREAFGGIWRGADPAAQPLEFALAIMGDINAGLAEWSIDARMGVIVDEIDAAKPHLARLPEAVLARLMMTRAVAILLGCPSHADVLDAQRHIEASLPHLPAGRQLLLGSILLNYLLWWRGDLAAARPYLNSLAPLAGRLDVPPLATMSWYYGALTIAYRDGEVEDISRLMREVVAFAQKWGTQHRLANAYWVATQAYAAAGDRDATQAALRGCSESAARVGKSDFSGAHFLRAAVALGFGDADMAIGEIMPGYERAGRSGDTQQRGMASLLLAMAFAVKGDAAAGAYIDELRDLAARSHSQSFQLHADLAETCLFAEQDDTTAFVPSWNAMAHFACRLGFRRISGMNAGHLGYLANRALNNGAEISVTRRLIALWSLPAPQRDTVHEAWPYRVEIRGLGGFSIDVDGGRITTGQNKAQRKPRELLIHLVIARGNERDQGWLADALWPRSDGDLSLHSLTMTVHRLRKLIGQDAIIHEDNHVRLNPLCVSTDLGRLRAALQRVQDETLAVPDRLAAFDRALRLYQGPLLPGVDTAAVVVERERLAALLAMEGLGVLLPLDPTDLGRALRLSRLRTALAGVPLPQDIEQLWPA